jgi:hypothetical protein
LDFPSKWHFRFPRALSNSARLAPPLVAQRNGLRYATEMKIKTMRRVYLREAAVLLVLARLAVRLASPARVFAWANRPPRHSQRFAVDEVAWISWAVETIGAKPWMKTQSLPQALAAHAMLRRRGISSRLCIGVAREGSALATRAWVEVGENKIVGGRDVGGFTRLAEFGGTTG